MANIRVNVVGVKGQEPQMYNVKKVSILYLLHPNACLTLRYVTIL